ncbi:MAG TPA: polyprenyl synthetase family protein, partial [Spirochaetota bacterium]
MGDALSQLNQQYLCTIENRIAEFYDRKIAESQFDIITRALINIKEYCLRPGKRIRPVLVVAGYAAYANNQKISDAVIDVAAAVEIFHSFL